MGLVISDMFSHFGIYLFNFFILLPSEVRKYIKNLSFQFLCFIFCLFMTLSHIVICYNFKKSLYGFLDNFFRFVFKFTILSSVLSNMMINLFGKFLIQLAYFYIQRFNLVFFKPT